MEVMSMEHVLLLIAYSRDTHTRELEMVQSKRFAKAILLVAFAIVAAVPGPAAAALCGSGLDSSDFTFRGHAADACAGPFSGNPNALTEFNNALAGVSDIGGNWQVLATLGGTGAASADWNGFRFSFSSEAVIGPGPASGNFWLTVTDLSPGTVPEYPITFDLLLAPRAGSQWVSYLFADEEFTMDATGSGTWFISFNNNNSPNAPSAGLSHMNFLLGGFDGCMDACNSPGGQGEPPDTQCEQGCAPSALAVPEPGSVALLSLGSVLLAVSRRRRR